MTVRNYSNVASVATVSALVAAADTTATLSSYTGFPAAPFAAVWEKGTASEEAVLVTGVSGSTVTMTRGYDGTTAKSHAAGATFQHAIIAKDLTEANAHVNATGAVHGLASAVVGVSDTQTLSNKTLTTPVLSAPTLTGAASGASLTLSLTLTVSGTTTLTTAAITTLNVSGNSALTGTLTVTGNTILNGTTFSAKATTLTTLTTSGAATLASAQVTATPASAADVARKDYVDSTNTSTLNSAKSYTDSSVAALAIADTGWIDVSGALGAGFSVGVDGTHYRVKNGICYYQFHVVRATGTTTGTVYTFPSGVRPGWNHWGLWESGGVPQAEAKITTSGTLLFSGSGSLTQCVYSGCFPVG